MPRTPTIRRIPSHHLTVYPTLYTLYIHSLNTRLVLSSLFIMLLLNSLCHFLTYFHSRACIRRTQKPMLSASGSISQLFDYLPQHPHSCIMPFLTPPPPSLLHAQ